MQHYFHDIIVTGFTHTLGGLSGLLDKAEAHASSSRYDVGALLSSRLFPDMFPFTRQVQLATDFAKGAAARLAGVDVPKWEDTETTMPELRARIAKTVAYLGSFAPDQFDAAGTRTIELKTPLRVFTFNGRDFLLQWAIPNFYFHCTTAYNLLRHNGVPVGKMDFLGDI